MDCGLAVSRICTACEFLDVDGSLARCPKCDAEMRLTFLSPPGQIDRQPRTVDRGAWQREFASRSRPADPSGRARLIQVSVGIGFQTLVLRLGFLVIGIPYVDTILSKDIGFQPFHLATLVLGIHVLSALVAGAIAGARCVDWLFQGIAVGLGYTVVLLARLLILLPFDMVANLAMPQEVLVPVLAGAMANTALVAAGAFLGRLLIPPLRQSIDGHDCA